MVLVDQVIVYTSNYESDMFCSIFLVPLNLLMISVLGSVSYVGVMKGDAHFSGTPDHTFLFCAPPPCFAIKVQFVGVLNNTIDNPMVKFKYSRVTNPNLICTFS